MSEKQTPESCAQCGSPIPPRAKACPECGADERTGWREQSIYDGLDLPESAFDDESRFARSRTRNRELASWIWKAVALLLLGVFLLSLLRGW